MSRPVRQNIRKRPTASEEDIAPSPSPMKVTTKQAKKAKRTVDSDTPQKTLINSESPGRVTRSQSGGSTEKENNPDKYQARRQNETEVTLSRKRLAFGSQASSPATKANSTPVAISSSENCGSHTVEVHRQRETSSNITPHHLGSVCTPEDDTQEVDEEEIQLSLDQAVMAETETQEMGSEAIDEAGIDSDSPPPKRRGIQSFHGENSTATLVTASKGREKTSPKTRLNGNICPLREKADQRKKRNEIISLLTSAMEHTKTFNSEQKEISDFMKEQSASIGAPSGVIKKIKFYNFMCHDSFEREWHPNLNFITGENGSGKSSILNGIIVGLGARAVVTSRTKSIKSLVKAGTNCAKTEITLGNSGALNMETYGDEITIQRIIDSKGISSYKLQVHGKYRPLRRTELDSILLTMGIQLDNPVSILNQETARSFLKSKDPKDKYRLFYSGTLLDKCESTLTTTEGNLQIADAHLKNQMKLVSIQREKLLKLEELMVLVRQVEKMLESLSKLEKEQAWSFVSAVETTKVQIENKVKQVEKDLTNLKSNYQKSLDEKQRLTETTTDQAEANRINGEIRQNNLKVDDLKRNIATLRKEMTEAEVTVRSSISQIKSETKSVQDLEKFVENLRNKGAEMAEKAKREFEAKTKALDDEKTQLVQQIGTLTNDSEQFRNGAEASKREVNELQDQHRWFGNQLVRKKEDLELLKKNTANKYAPYGRQMQELVAKIQANASRFKVLPRGPLGACFTVKNEKWICIIEHILNNHLFNFVVDCQSDRNLLSQLIQQTYGMTRQSLGRGLKRPDIYIRTFESQPMDITRGNASMRDHPTILDEIEVDDFIVRNSLIDFAQVERILLFNDTKSALRILKEETTPEFPRTCLRAFTLDFYRIIPSPNYRIDPLDKRLAKKQPDFLKSTNLAQKKNLEAEIVDLTDQINKMKPILEGKLKEERQFRVEYDNRRQGLKTVEGKYQQVLFNIEQTKRSCPKTPDISTYLEELDEKKSDLAKVVEKQESAQKILAQNKTQTSELVSKKNELDTNASALQARLMQLESESENLHTKLNTLQNIISRMEKQVTELEIKKAQTEASLQTLEDELKRKVLHAEVVSPVRVNTQRGSDAIKRDVDKLKGQIEDAKKKTVDKDTITKDLNNTRKAYHESMKNMQVNCIVYRTLKKLFKAHEVYFNKSRNQIGALLTSLFKGLLSPRRYEGRLIIEHDTKELYYCVCADKEANSNILEILKTNNNKYIKKHMVDFASGLSGGERSFATICFIVSLWQVMEAPFFMLDEFDVFMDAFNRKTSQAALIYHAQQHRSHQFFFFTPLELSMQPDPNLSSILRLFPPKRSDQSQSVLGNETSDDEDEVVPGPSSRQAKRAKR